MSASKSMGSDAEEADAPAAAHAVSLLPHAALMIWSVKGMLWESLKLFKLSNQLSPGLGIL